jgi:hypothetical protein
VKASVLYLVLALAVAAAACSGDSGTAPTSELPGTEASTVTAPAPDVLVDPGSCDRSNVTDCSTLGLVFETSRPLSETLDALRDWLVVAVVRAEPACVVVSNWPDNEDGLHEESRFAYVEAHRIRERRLNAPGSPPITGHHIASGYWDHFEAEWRAAVADDAEIAVAIVYAPTGTTAANSGVSGLADVVPIPSYRTDTTDDGFPGELYIEGHELPSELGGPTEQTRCTG